MVDRQALLDKLLDYLQSSPPPPEYLAGEPASINPFDPYQMVSEWIALRQEMKQQGKLLQSAQERLQRELDTARSQNEQLQQQLEASQRQASSQYAAEFSAQEKRVEKEQEKLWRELLSVLDDLDRACAYWEKQPELLPATVTSAPTTHTFQKRLAGWLFQLAQKLAPAERSGTAATTASLTEILNSDRQGVKLIRRTLLNILKQHQIVPITAQGQPFDPQYMYAIGRQASSDPENTVIQEVIQGYLWRDRVLREAQVIVSAGKENTTLGEF